MNFTHLLGNENIIKEAYDAVHPVEEGWGTFFSSFLQVGPINGQAVAFVISSDNLQKALRDKKVYKYVKTECDKIFAAERKHDKSITKDLPHGFFNMMSRWWHDTDEVPYFSWARRLHFRSHWLTKLFCNCTVDGYTTTFFYDSDHIEALTVELYSKDKDQIKGYRLPAPKNNNLYFRKEY